MSQIVIYNHSLQKKHIIETDVKIKVYDCITPQKTTFEIKKTENIDDNDIVLLKDEENYIGVIDEISVGTTTTISMYPIEHIFDNELDVDKLDGTMNVVEYLTTQITKNFIETDDVLMRVPFVFESQLSSAVTYKTIVDTTNLLDIINDIYLNTGVYLSYEPVYVSGRLSGIKVVFKNVADQEIRKIKYNNPQIIDNVNYEFCNTNPNKVTITYGDKKYKLYIREDNNLTTNPNDEYRVKKVINKNIEFTAEDDLKDANGNINLDQLAEAIIIMAQKELQGDVFGYKIEFTMHINPRRKWSYRQACVFTSENKEFKSLVTRIEYVTSKTIRITLGAYRTKLTEKIQKLTKPPKEVGSTLGGITATNGFMQGLYWFEQDADGNLYVCSESMTDAELTTMFELDENKNIYINYADGQRQALSVDAEGNLVGGY